MYVGALHLLNERIISLNDDLCSQCAADNCLHRKSFSIAMEESCLPVSDPLTSTSSFLYTLSNKIVCVVHDHSIHIYKPIGNKWYCTSCPGVCPERKVVIDYQETLDTHLQNHEYHPMQFRTVTTEPIPHTLSEEMRTTYRTQISQGLNLSEQVRSSAQVCRKSQNGLNIYTKSDVISLPHHKNKFIFSIPSYYSPLDIKIPNTS